MSEDLRSDAKGQQNKAVKGFLIAEGPICPVSFRKPEKAL